MRFEELNWFDVENYLASDDRLIIVIGSCEQHGYLSLLTDVKIPLALADAASKITGVLVSPPLNFGCSPYFLAYPGTISLRGSTLSAVIEDIVQSVYKVGFRRLLFLNGHGGNVGGRTRLYELANEHNDLRIIWYDWWLSNSVTALAQELELKPSHGNWLEAFSFTQVSKLPEGDKLPPKVPGLLGADASRQIFGDGSFGGQYHVDEAIMERLFATLLQDVIHLLESDFAD